MARSSSSQPGGDSSAPDFAEPGAARSSSGPAEDQPAPSQTQPAQGAWDEWAAVLDELSRQAKLAPDTDAQASHGQRASDDQFYAELLRRCVTALSATEGMVWSADETGRIRRRSTCGADLSELSDDERRDHEELLAESIAQSKAEWHARRHGVLLVSPIRPEGSAAASALVELHLRPGASPGAYDAAAQFLQAASDIAADRQLRVELRRLRADKSEQDRLAALGRRVQGSLNLKQTSARIANETRDVVDCDRVSLLVLKQRRPRLMAVSGVDRVDRRSLAARGLEDLAKLVCQLGEPVYFTEQEGRAEQEVRAEQDDRAEQVAGDTASDMAAAALDRYADLSHARQLIAAPLFEPRQASTAEDPTSDATPAVIGVLVAEQFDATSGDLAKQRLAEAAELCGPALASAVEVDSLPLIGLSRATRGLLLPRNIRRAVLAATVLAATIGGLAFTPTSFYVESPGELQPVVQRHIFAPRDSLIDKVHVVHGDKVQAGALLLSLRDPELNASIQRVEGELATTRRQLEAVRATRTNRDARDSSPADSYRLSAEEQQLNLRIKTLTAQQLLLASERKSLEITSPLAGTVVSWQLEQKIAGRPVERGQSLLSVADTEADWQVELQTPDDRIGYVLAAMEEANAGTQERLRVEYRLASEERGFATGTISQIAQRAEPGSDAAGQQRHVAVVVTPDNPRQPAVDSLGLRPGLSVRARIDCGRKSLGYVWLHDVWHTLKTWWEF